jgi:hypothetical protein
MFITTEAWNMETGRTDNCGNRRCEEEEEEEEEKRYIKACTCLENI